MVLLKDNEGIPRVYFYHEDENNNYMVMDLLGKSIEYLFNKNRTLSLKTTMMIGMQMVIINSLKFQIFY